MAIGGAESAVFAIMDIYKSPSLFGRNDMPGKKSSIRQSVYKAQ
jgi:hypothetical protein